MPWKAQTALALSPSHCPSRSTQLHPLSMGSAQDSKPHPHNPRLLQTPCEQRRTQLQFGTRLKLAEPVFHMIKPIGRMSMQPTGIEWVWAGMPCLVTLQPLQCCKSAARLACMMSRMPNQARAGHGPASSAPLQPTQVTLSGARSVTMCAAQPCKTTDLPLLMCLPLCVKQHPLGTLHGMLSYQVKAITTNVSSIPLPHF